MKKSKVVVIGGGSGLSNLLKGLKYFPLDLKAIVSVADDGGSTGKLRKDYDIPAPGDIRNVMVSLSRNESLIEDLFQYRFKEGNLKGHCLGNIMLAGMLDLTGSMTQATKALSDLLNMEGEVIPVSNQSLALCAELNNNTVIKGESVIGNFISQSRAKNGLKINKVFYEQKARASSRAIKAIKQADFIIIGIGSLHTSIAPNLAIEGIKKEIKKSSAEKIYICNAMEQPGETVGYSVADHVKVIESYLDSKVDTILVNQTNVELESVIGKYLAEGASLVKEDVDKLADYNVLKKDLLAIENEYIRHDSFKLGMTIYEHIIKK